MAKSIARERSSGTQRLLEGKVTIVTGASRGIGKATARVLATHGATVVLAARTEDAIDSLSEEITSGGGQAMTVPVDVADPETVKKLVSRTIDAYGRLDAAFNNAGATFPPTPLADVPLERFDQLMAVNARGIFLCMKYEIPAMLAAGGGSIVNMSSTGGLRAVPGLAPYVASKHAILGLTKVAALDYAKQGIRVNALVPATILTEQLASLDEAQRQRIAAWMPVGRMGTPEEVGEVVAWLLSEQSSFITGAAIPIDGGKLAAGA